MVETKGAYVNDPLITSVSVRGEAAAFIVRRIYCVGRNYVSHIREMKEGDEREPPFFFQKPTDAIVRNGGAVAYPPHTNDLQYEVELVIAIGAGGRDIPVADALDHVFGYAVGIDMTRRDRQRDAFARGLPWEIGKSFDQSAPCGTLSRASDVGHKTRGPISLTVNGELRQQADLAQMIWNVPEIIVKLSTQYTLSPGDLIYTGTPAGVGAVRPGDVLRAEVDGLAALHVGIVAQPELDHEAQMAETVSTCNFMGKT